MDTHRRSLISALTVPCWVLLAGTRPCISVQASSPIPMPAFKLAGREGMITWSPTPPQSAVDRKWLYLDFWASWCGPCRLSFPWMNRMHDQWSSKGLRIVGVSVDRKREDALGFLRANPARFEIGFDPEASLARTLDIKTMPTSLLVAPDGRIVYRHEGFTASMADRAAKSIQDALGWTG